MTLKEDHFLSVEILKRLYCLQADREGTHREADQDAPQGNHDAEGPGECHQQRGEKKAFSSNRLLGLDLN